jgi:hypothetical protein
MGLTLVLIACAPAAQEAPPTAEVVEQTQPPPELTTDTPAETPTSAQPPTATEPALNHADLLDELLFSISSVEAGEEILAEIAASGDPRFVAGLIDTLRYQRGLSPQIGETLNSLTGQELPPDWFAWAEWAGQHPEITSFAAYPAWKSNLFAQIDPNFRRFVHAGLKVAPDSRVEEIVWGGVRVDGIPALDNPTMIDPEEADYLVPHERVFGVSLNGDTRAYPARFLDWHEMFNDVVGGEPVSLAY